MRLRLRSRDLDPNAGQAVLDAPASLGRPLARPRGRHGGDPRIGTVFRVRRAGADAQVAGRKGRVGMSWSRGRGVELGAGQAMDIGTLRPLPASVAGLERETAWREGRLRFDGTPLSEVLALLGHYRAAPVRWVQGLLRPRTAPVG